MSAGTHTPEHHESACMGEGAVHSPLPKLSTLFSTFAHEVDPWMSRATAMLKARPAVTIAIAAGVGFALGLTVFTRLGRVAFLGAVGLGTELLLQRARAGRMEPSQAS